MDSVQSSQIKSLPFVTLDVFTEHRYAGNPLAIVFLPAPEDFAPSQAKLQVIATEFNLSETIFIEHATSEDHHHRRRRARIFTTTREILFAGHPTIGAATYLLVHDASKQVVEALVPGAGPIQVSHVPSKPGYVRAIVPQTFHQHAAKCSASQLLAIHSTLEPFVSRDQSFPIVSIVHGMTWVLVEMRNLQALATIRVGNANANIMADSSVLDKGWEYAAPIGVYLYVRSAEDEKDGVETIRTRMMIRGIEDPATGSAASALTGYLALTEAETQGEQRQWKIAQGVEMGRRSEIGVRVDLEGNKIHQIELSGTATVVSEGRVGA